MVNPLMASMISIDLSDELSKSARRSMRTRKKAGRSLAIVDQQSVLGTGQPPSWDKLKPMILEAIKNDEQPAVFEALLADVSNLMNELIRTG